MRSSVLVFSLIIVLFASCEPIDNSPKTCESDSYFTNDTKNYEQHACENAPTSIYRTSYIGQIFTSNNVMDYWRSHISWK